MRLLSVLLLLSTVGCGTVELPDQPTLYKSGTSAVYPVSPWVHQGNEEQIVDEISGVKAEISNSNAYARYALELLGASSVQNDEVDPQTWALEMALRADHGIEFTSLVSLNTVYANEHDYVSEYEQYTHHVRRIQSDALNRTGREIIDGEARLRVCVSMGHSVDRCCEYLLWLDGVRMDQEDFAGDAVTTTQSILDKLASQNTTTKPINPFSHSGVRSWLSYCAPLLTEAPQNIEIFKGRFGDYHHDGDWTREFHPVSPAKQAGRRIFRRQLQDGTLVSVAESTADDCSVIETETIVKRAGQQAKFWVFSENNERVAHAFFPSRKPGIDAVKYAPNTCMGCHYTFDTRRFNIVTPSFDALKLTRFSSAEGPAWRDHAHCADAQDIVVHHADGFPH